MVDIKKSLSQRLPMYILTVEEAAEKKLGNKLAAIETFLQIETVRFYTVVYS